MSDDAEDPSGEVPARPVIRAAKPSRPPENLRTTVRLDGRTKAAKAAKRFEADLVAHVGGRPSATQAALIAQGVQLSLRLAAMDDAFAARGEQSAHDGRQYLAWSNALSRLLRSLGTKGTAQKPPNLADYLAARQTGGAKAAAS